MDAPVSTAATTVPTRLGPLHVQTAGTGPSAVLWHSLFVAPHMGACPLAAGRRLVLIDGPAHGPNPGAPPVHPRRLRRRGR
jgi:hypothetical protein